MSLIIRFVFALNCIGFCWTPQTQADAVTRIGTAVQFLQSYGAQVQVSKVESVTADLAGMSWEEACNSSIATDGADARTKVVLVMFQSPRSWPRPGCATPGGVLVAYNGGNWGFWYPFSSLTAHELGHTLGASDAYRPDGSCTRAPDVMCTETRLLDAQTMTEIQSAHPEWVIHTPQILAAPPLFLPVAGARLSYLHRVRAE